MRGQAGADRSAPETDDPQLLGRPGERSSPVLERLGPAPEDLAPRDRHGILKMRAPRLDDAARARGVTPQRADERDQLTVQRLQHLERHQADRGRRDVVGRLAEVDVVVGMDRMPAPAPAAQPLVGEAGDHLVDVHVGGRAGARLQHVDRGGIRHAAGGHAGRRRDDSRRPPWRQQPQPCVHARGSQLDERVGADEGRMRQAVGELEGPSRPLGEGPPECPPRDLDRSEAVTLHARGPPRARSRSAPAWPGCGRAPGGVGGHVGAPHLHHAARSRVSEVSRT